MIRMDNIYFKKKYNGIMQNIWDETTSTQKLAWWPIFSVSAKL